MHNSEQSPIEMQKTMQENDPKPGQTPVLSIDDPSTPAAVQTLLGQDGIFVAPTDTVFGVFSRYDSVAALERIYIAKGRPPEKAIPVLIGAPDQMEPLIRGQLPSVAHELMARFWPGPLTLVLQAQPTLPPILTAGATTIAVRMPAHDGLLRLLQALGPLAATSANRSGQQETHTVAQVQEQLDGRVDLILDDAVASRAPTPASTIVDLSPCQSPVDETDSERNTPRLLREGPIGHAVRALLGLSQAVGDKPVQASQ